MKGQMEYRHLIWLDENLPAKKDSYSKFWKKNCAGLITVHLKASSMGGLLNGITTGL